MGGKADCRNPKTSGRARIVKVRSGIAPGPLNILNKQKRRIKLLTYLKKHDKIDKNFQPSLII